MHLDILHLHRNLTMHYQEMSKALGANWNLQMQKMRHFQIEHSALDFIHDFVQTSLCMGLPMKICTHEGVWPSQYSILEKLKHILSTSDIAIHALLMYWQVICHFSLYFFLLWLIFFWQLLENFCKDISLCYDSSITTFTRSDMGTV